VRLPRCALRVAPPALALALLAGALLACTPGPAAATAPADRPAAAQAAQPASPAQPAPRVVIETAAGARATVTVELARTDAEREHGLMGRRTLDEEAGMLFLFEGSEPRAFWMKNTLIPLDMIFIDDGGRVAGIVREAAPLTLTPRSPGVPARYVLEVRGGWAERHGVAAGDRVRFEGVPL
jgi:uncharacterized protein